MRTWHAANGSWVDMNVFLQSLELYTVHLSSSGVGDSKCINTEDVEVAILFFLCQRNMVYPTINYQN